jgi:hypothetical protein
MNRKIFLGVAVGVLIVILGAIGSGVGSIKITESQDGDISETQSTPQIKPLQVELVDISVTKISERAATIKIAFNIINPNSKSFIVQTLDYQLFETGYSETEQISGGEIGSRPTGMVEFGSNYYVLLGDNSITLKDTIHIKNSGNTPELWTGLKDNTSTWHVTGDVFYNLSSMTSGQENELHFDFTR